MLVKPLSQKTKQNKQNTSPSVTVWDERMEIECNLVNMTDQFQNVQFQHASLECICIPSRKFMSILIMMDIWVFLHRHM